MQLTSIQQYGTMTMHCTTRTLLSGVFKPSPSRTASTTTLPSPFLLPALTPPQTQTSSFSTSAPAYARKRPRPDKNPARGVSALYRTGLNKQRLSVTVDQLPKPVLDPSLRSQVEVDEDHGLWDFFPADRKSMATPEELNSHGRAWAIEELRLKDWDDLHRLWWSCLKERNRLITYTLERERIGNMYGGYESDARERVIKRTMRHIKYVLTERWYSWENARVAAMDDPEINMYADLDAGELAFLPKQDGDGVESHAAAESDAELQAGAVPSQPPKPKVQA